MMNVQDKFLDADLQIGWHLATFCLYRRTAHSVPGGQGGCEYVRPLRESRLVYSRFA